MGVSKNRGTPKWMVKIMVPTLWTNGWFGFFPPYFWFNTHVYTTVTIAPFIGSSWALRILSTASCTSWNHGKQQMIRLKQVVVQGDKGSKSKCSMWMPERGVTHKSMIVSTCLNDIHKLKVWHWSYSPNCDDVSGSGGMAIPTRKVEGFINTKKIL